VLPHTNAYAIIRWRAAAAGIDTKLSNHNFPGTRITAYLKVAAAGKGLAALANGPA